MELVIRYNTFVDAPPEDVYAALTTTEGLNAWFTTDARVDTAASHIRLHWDDFGLDRQTVTDGGPILEATPPRRFVFLWHPIGAAHPTRVALDLAPHGRGTRVDLTESGYSSEQEDHVTTALTVAAGWGEALALLKCYMEHGSRYEHPSTWHRGGVVSERDARL